MRVGIAAFCKVTNAGRGTRRKGALPQGAEIVRHACREAGYEVLDLLARWESVDVLMVSLFWWEHAYNLVGYLAAHGIDYRREKRAERPIVFAGGGLVSYNPAPLRDVIDIACIGDGEEVAPRTLAALATGARGSDLASMIPGLYVSASDNLVEWQQVSDVSATLRWPFRHAMNERTSSGVKVHRDIERRIEIARGCRRKCLFCGVSWTRAYRENDAEAIAAVVRFEPGAINGFAPDPMHHSGWTTIKGAFDSRGKHNLARNLSMHSLLQGHAPRGQYTTGIDGLSARVRAAVHKPLTRAQLVAAFVAANRTLGGLGIDVILGLPGETEDDYAEWFGALAEAGEAMRPGPDVQQDHFGLLVATNAFSPTPGTPLQWAGIDWRDRLMERYAAATERYLPRGDGGKHRHIHHYHQARPLGPASRLFESAALRGGPELAALIWTVGDRRARFVGPSGVGSLLALAQRLGVRDALEAAAGEKSTARPTPWGLRVKPLFPRESLLKCWHGYRRRMGLDVAPERTPEAAP